jgi:hypothetical protein
MVLFIYRLTVAHLKKNFCSYCGTRKLITESHWTWTLWIQSEHIFVCQFWYYLRLRSQDLQEISSFQVNLHIFCINFPIVSACNMFHQPHPNDESKSWSSFLSPCVRSSHKSATLFSVTRIILSLPLTVSREALFNLFGNGYFKLPRNESVSFKYPFSM